MGIQERRERERQARRSAVLEATRSLLQERGFNGTTTKQIAERSELSEATLFWYFSSKDEIFISLLFEGIDFMAKGIEEIGEADLSPREKLIRLWSYFSEVRIEHPEYYQIFAYVAHPHSTLSITEEVKAEIARRSGDDFRRLASLLQQTLGLPNSRLVADLLWGSFVGLMVLRDSRVNLGAQPHPNEEDLSEAFKLILSGIAPELSEGAEP